MKNLNQFIIEKFKINSQTAKSNDNPLFDSLDKLLEDNKKSVIFSTKEIEEYYHIANLVISYKNDYITLNHILIKDKNEGWGTKFMKDLCEWCDINKKNICLTPSNDFGSHLGRLKKFYKRFGFIENKGSHADFTTRESMIRKQNN